MAATAPLTGARRPMSHCAFPGELDAPAELLMARALFKRSCNKRGALERGPESLRIIAARDLEYQASDSLSLSLSCLSCLSLVEIWSTRRLA